MLLNLSNHPSSHWTVTQKETAQNKYDTIQDLPFPNIPPEATEQDIGNMVKEYIGKIKPLNPTAVHLMGEMTFTFALVTQLKAAGIPCIASTTNRIVEEREGKKIVQFQFVQFRTY